MATKILDAMQTNCEAIWPDFIAQNTLKNCLNSAICFPSSTFSQKFFLSITDALSCINVRCFYMACSVIVKPITYFFTSSANACTNCIEYISLFSVYCLKTRLCWTEEIILHNLVLHQCNRSHPSQHLKNWVCIFVSMTRYRDLLIHAAILVTRIRCKRSFIVVSGFYLLSKQGWQMIMQLLSYSNGIQNWCA